MTLRLVFVFLLILAALPARAQEPRGDADWPVAVEELLAVQRFELERSFEFDWSAEAKSVRSGTLVVIKVDPELVVSRNALEPVLYAGDTTVQRLNSGAGSGVVIGIVPGEIDLNVSPIWFGAPGLPESVTAEVIEKERDQAREARIAPLAKDMIERASAETVRAEDFADLLRTHVADLVLEYAPEEKELVASWRLPVVSAPQKDSP